MTALHTIHHKLKTTEVLMKQYVFKSYRLQGFFDAYSDLEIWF